MTKYFKKDGDEYVEVTESLHTQSDIDNIVEKRLERDRKKYADYDDLKEKAGKVETIKSEYEEKIKSFDTEKSELEGKLKKANLETDKVKIVSEFKLSDELAEFVTGDNADDMRKRAEKLANNAGSGKIPIKKSGKPEEGKQADTKTVAKELLSPESDD